MEDIETELRELGEKNGFDISLDENDACTLELADGRPVVLQLRAALNELDFVASSEASLTTGVRTSSPTFSPRTTTGRRRSAPRFRGIPRWSRWS